MTAAKKDILQGWKDIAAYVSRDVRTVKRWEKQRGLPVRRMPGDGRANVYALIPDLDNWLSSGVPVEEEPTSTLEAEVNNQPIDIPASPIADAVSVPNTSLAKATHRSSSPRRLWISTAAALCLVTIAAVAFGLRAHYREQPTTDVPPFSPTQTARSVKYSSKIAGVDALYLRGIYFYEQRTPDTLARALKCFLQAIAADPGYAPAYAGLAQTYNLVREYSMMPDAEAYTKAKAAAQHAIALDPNLSEAHASLGFVEFFWDWNAPSAEQEFRTAIKLDPNSALAHHWYGSMLTHQGRFDESLFQLDLAQRLQPTSTSILSDRAFALGNSGRRNEAADLLQEVLTEDPRSPAPHYILACISLIEPQDIPRYLDEMRRFATLRHDPQKLRVLDTLDPAYRSGGTAGMWKAMLDLENRAHPDPRDRTFTMAATEAALGMHEQSIHDLELLAARRDPGMIGVTIDPMLESVRHDPRFTKIIQAVGGRIPR